MNLQERFPAAGGSGGASKPMRNRGLGFTKDIFHPPEQIPVVGILPIDLAAFDSTTNCMVPSTRGIDAGSTRQA